MIIRKLLCAMQNTDKKPETCLENENLRLDKTAFTRRRRLGAVRTVMIILERIYKSLRLQLDSFFSRLGENSVSKQALSKARQFLDPLFIREFADMTAEIAASDKDIDGYKGLRLIAIDGSDIALENTPELRSEFGCSGSKKDAATALCSIAYGVEDHVIYDSQIDRYETDERELAKRHVSRLQELGLGGSLLIFDRWYPSAEFIAHLSMAGFPFVMRVRRKWNLQADSIKRQGWITINHAGEGLRVRVLKITLPCGEVETLLTSLNQKQFPIGDAAQLYWERWKIETAYDLIKSTLQLENFSGKTKVTVLQDFYATIYLANLVAFAAQEADEIIMREDAEKSLKYKRKANRARTTAKLREIFFFAVTEPDPISRKAMLDSLARQCAKYPVSIVPGRSPIRKIPRKKRFHTAKKSVP